MSKSVDLLILMLFLTRRILAKWLHVSGTKCHGHSSYEVFLFTESACSSHALNDIYPTWHAVFSVLTIVSDINFTWKKHFCKFYINQLALIISEHIFLPIIKIKYIIFSLHAIYSMGITYGIFSCEIPLNALPMKLM